MSETNEWPKRCISTQEFAESFPATLKRAKTNRLVGQVLRKAKAKYPECYIVKWNGLTVPWNVHKKFFKLSEDRHGDSR
ncbi:MAG: hypothetical protein E5Y10_24350 [Mesorhizobium sp.]|nr:MAG: hypothetical protein E5Y10_24350 [Mesorhizobium sp.]